MLSSHGLGALIEECALEVTELYTDQGVTLHLEGLEELGQVLLHRNTFRRLLLNVMQNAVEAMPQGGTLALRGRQQEADRLGVQEILLKTIRRHELLDGVRNAF